jgi:hypothetical protein
VILASKCFGCPIDISKSLSLERFFDISCQQPILCLRSPWRSAKRSAGITCSLQQRNLGGKKKRWDSGMLKTTWGRAICIHILYVSIAVWHTWHTWHTLWEVNIDMENGRCIRDLPIEHADSGIISYMLDCQRVWPWFYHIVTCYLVAPHWYYIQAWHHDALFTTVAVAHQDGVKDYSNLTKEQKLDFLSRTACGRRKFLVVCWSKS